MCLSCALIFVFHLWPYQNKFDSPLSNILLSSNGILMNARVAEDEQWRMTPLETLPKHYAVAVVNFEDSAFYYHPGINPFAIGRAFISNLKQGRIVSGGSTITMQLARLIRKNQPRTFRHKLIEALLALKLEWHLSKSEILLLYANNAPFGGNVVGISAASQRYFGRDAKELSWAEAATLAVLPNSPSLIHLGRSRDKLYKKRNRLLAKLKKENYLSDLEYQLALLEPIPEKPSPFPKLAQHFFETLIKENKIPQKNQVSAATSSTDQSIYSSTLDSNLQRKVEAIAEQQINQLYHLGVQNLAIVVIDNQHLTTAAYVGNQTLNNQQGASNPFSANVDIAVRPRSTGSILKPLLYGLMLDGGYLLPETLIADTPVSYNGFSPENYDKTYKGAVPAKLALAQSLNIPAVNMLKNYGVGQYYNALQQLGMKTLFRPADDYGLSLILGGAEGNLWELTGIFARVMASANSISASNSAIKKIVNIPPEKDLPLSLSSGAAWLTIEALLEVTRPGNNQWWRDYVGSQAIAWKTGTSYGLRDAWAIGSNPRYTVGVWAGNANGEGIAGLSGRIIAAPVLFKVFDVLPTSAWPVKSLAKLKPLNICEENGYLENFNCKTTITYAPKDSYFQQQSPHHFSVYLDNSHHYRVHGGCAQAAMMNVVTAFRLPPAMAFYWKQHNPYASLPPWRADCVKDLAQYTDEKPLDIIYPLDGSKIYLPKGLDGKRQMSIFKAHHQQSSQKLFWHLDDKYLGETMLFHEMAVVITPGWHKLVVMDEQGAQQTRWFRGLATP